MTIEKVFFNQIGQHVAGQTEHPQKAMADLAAQNGFAIISATPESIADGWRFEIEYEERPTLPDYVFRDRG